MGRSALTTAALCCECCVGCFTIRCLRHGQACADPARVDWLAGHAALYYISRLAHLGIRVFEYEPGFMHQKVALIDDATSLVGTANFDNRSFRLNFEVTALVYDEDFAARIAAMLRDDFDTASELDVAGLEDRGWWWRLKVGVARLAAPIL